MEWLRVLKPGGMMVIEVPCLDQILNHFFYCLRKGKPINDQLTMWRLYGDPHYRNEHMVHRWCFSASELQQVMEQVGFRDVKVGPPVYHHPQGDMRITGVK
jgi:predicted SAM-dependent methyltransferase